MLDGSDVIAFAATTDLAAARAFYGGVLGLAVLSENPFACAFDAHGTMLRVTLVDEVARPGYTVLGWRVTDIGSSVAALESAGIRFTRYDGVDQDAQGIWTTPEGARIAWFTDPDGNVLSLSQFAPDAG